MSEMIAIPRHPAANARTRLHPRILRALLGLAVAVLGFAIAMSAFDVVRTALAERTAPVEPVVQYPRQELPKEWRWQPGGVEYESMYRRLDTPRIDWIRNGRR